MKDKEHATEDLAIVTQHDRDHNESNKETRHGRTESAVERATEWLDRELFPILGPPALGPFDKPAVDPPEEVSQRNCPICGYAMAEHIVEFSDDSGQGFLSHPDASIHEVMQTGRLP